MAQRYHLRGLVVDEVIRVVVVVLLLGFGAGIVETWWRSRG